jgi:hypothetical protein
MARSFMPILGLILLALATAPAASAQTNCPGGSNNASPDQSEVDQYSETVPGPCGEQAAGSGGSGPSGLGADSGSGSLPFTGFVLLGLLIAGVFLIASGALGRLTAHRSG